MADPSVMVIMEPPEPKGLPPPASLTSEHHPLFRAYLAVHGAMLAGHLDTELAGNDYADAVMKVYTVFKNQADTYEEIVVKRKMNGMIKSRCTRTKNL